MEKQEFLDKMRLALVGKVSGDTVTETLRYYEEYINTQVRLGNSIDEVMEKLGDPRLIAKTIVETSGKQGDAKSESRDFVNQNETAGKREVPEWKYKVLELVTMIPGWVWLIVFFALLLIVLGFVFKVLIAVAPVLVIAGIVFYFIHFMRGGDGQ